jgi:hypothetical protein
MVKSQAQLTKQWCRTNINRDAVCLSPLAPFFNPLGPFPPPGSPWNRSPRSPWDGSRPPRSPVTITLVRPGTVRPFPMGPLPLIHLRWTVPLVLPWDHSICSPLRPFPPIIHGTIPPVPLVAIPPFASRAFLHIPTWVCPNLVPSGIVPPVTPGTVPPTCPWGRFTCTPWDRSACSLWDC